MLSTLQLWDRDVLIWIHQNLHGALGNDIIPYFRKANFWIPLYVVLVVFFIKWWRAKAFIPVLFLVASVGLSDLISVHVFKNNIQRLRPCHFLVSDPQFEPLINCGGQYGFVSSHAANHMAMAVFLVMLFQTGGNKWRYAWLAWAVLIGFSQVYVGVHYPLDVICGFLLGGFIGWTLSKIMKRYFPSFFESRPAIA